MIEKLSLIFDAEAPIFIGDAARLLDLQPRPSIEIRFRHAAHCHAFAFLKLDVIRFGRSAVF